MSVYNGEGYLKEALDSVLAQTRQDFEFIIINDGSTDDTAKILASYKDERLRVHDQENKGLVAALNRGVKLAGASLIARQDADDCSELERLEKQLAFLEANPETVVIGSSMKVMDKSGRSLHEHRVLLNDPELKQELLVRSPFAHGSAMFRKQAFEKAGGYHQDEWPAEDYGLWLRMAQYGKFANIDEPLYVYREGVDSISSGNLQLQNQKKQAIQAKAWHQRKHLLAGTIKTVGYPALAMGQFRVERITGNLLFTFRRGLAKASLPTAITAGKHLLADRGLRRKCARLVAVKLRLKHA
jgi:glycosyltransferase involved in cell wall biosynthesis